MRPKERQADGNLEEQQWQKELVRQESQQEIGELKVQVISLQSHPTETTDGVSSLLFAFGKLRRGR